MKNELQGKRLLVLGGSLWKEVIKDFCKENDITIIATGNDHSAGIFDIADECYDIDSTDSENMKKLIKDKHIDGVYMGGSEPVIAIACQYINELGLPCYCTKEHWDFLENKANFKEICIKCKLPVVPKFDVNDNNINSYSDIEFPVITKPVDGCGSNGFSICRNIEELKKGYIKAKENSLSGKVLTEKFVKNTSVVVFYSISNGIAKYCGLEDKFTVFYKNTESYVAGLHIFKSKFEKDFISKYDDKIKNMFKQIGLNEGPVWIEIFHDGNNYYFNEVGYRYSGSVSIYPVDYLYDINQVAVDIYFALTGKSKIYDFPSLIRKKIKRGLNYAMYSIHLIPGKISKIDGIKKLDSLDNIIKIPLTKTIGSVIIPTGTISQVGAFVHFVYETKDELEEIINYIHDNLKIYDENGNNMVNRMLDINSIDL